MALPSWKWTWIVSKRGAALLEGIFKGLKQWPWPAGGEPPPLTVFLLCLYGMGTCVGGVMLPQGGRSASKTLKPLNPPKKNSKKKWRFRAKWGGPLGHLTWPLNPPQKNKNKNKTKNKRTTTKKTTRKTKKDQKNFSIINQNFLLFCSVQKRHFWQRAPPKHYRNKGFRKHILKNTFASRNGHFTQKPKSRNSKYHYFGAFFSLSTTKTQRCFETPIFIVL